MSRSVFTLLVAVYSGMVPPGSCSARAARSTSGGGRPSERGGCRRREVLLARRRTPTTSQPPVVPLHQRPSRPEARAHDSKRAAKSTRAVVLATVDTSSSIRYAARGRAHEQLCACAVGLSWSRESHRPSRSLGLWRTSRGISCVGGRQNASSRAAQPKSPRCPACSSRDLRLTKKNGSAWRGWRLLARDV